MTDEEIEEKKLAGPYGTEARLRYQFWQAFPRFRKEKLVGKEHNAYSDECRQAFHEWKDALERSGQMPDEVCQNSTLG